MLAVCFGPRMNAFCFNDSAVTACYVSGLMTNWWVGHATRAAASKLLPSKNVCVYVGIISRPRIQQPAAYWDHPPMTSWCPGSHLYCSSQAVILVCTCYLHAIATWTVLAANRSALVTTTCNLQ